MKVPSKWTLFIDSMWEWEKWSPVVFPLTRCSVVNHDLWWNDDKIPRPVEISKVHHCESHYFSSLSRRLRHMHKERKEKKQNVFPLFTRNNCTNGQAINCLIRRVWDASKRDVMCYQSIAWHSVPMDKFRNWYQLIIDYLRSVVCVSV